MVTVYLYFKEEYKVPIQREASLPLIPRAGDILVIDKTEYRVKDVILVENDSLVTVTLTTM